MLADPRMQEAAPDSTNSLASRLGRIEFRPSASVEYLHTSAPANWQGAFLTHVRVGRGFSFQGSWSWLRLSAKLSLSRARFPGWAGAAAEPASARLQIGVPNEPYSGSWTAPSESANLFVNPAMIENVFHAPYSETLILAAARNLHEHPVIEHLLQALLADVAAGSLGGPLLGETIISLVLNRLHAPQPVSPGVQGA